MITDFWRFCWVVSILRIHQLLPDLVWVCTVKTPSSFIFFLSYLKWSFLCNLIPTFLCGGMEDYFWWSRKIKTIFLPQQPTVPGGCTRNNLMHRERLTNLSEFMISFPRKKRREVFLKYWTIIAQVVELLRIASRKN